MGSWFSAFRRHRHSTARWQGSLHQLPFSHAPRLLLLSLQEILAMLGFCRSRDSMPELESLGLHLPRKMVLCTERKVAETTRGLVYSYIGDDGKTYTVKYSAGIN